MWSANARGSEMRALVTGGGGFVGQWLIRALLERGDMVDAAGLGDTFTGPRVLDDDERRNVRWLPTDMRDADAIERAVEQSMPDSVFHLAGVSFPPEADRSPETTFDVNTVGVVRLLSSIRRRQAAGTLDPVVIVVGSSVQYGAHDPAAMPLDEFTVQRPASIYGASKAAQEEAALAYHRSAGLRVICTRSFNHSGVGHGADYLLPSLVARARKIAGGAPGPLVLGNDVVRDYLHVADVASAYVALAERGTPGEAYNVASGRGLSVRQLAGDVLLHAGVRADISTTPSLARPSDIPVLVGSPAKLAAATGWTPLKTHADIINDLLHAATD